jgi:hypothetical protein
VYVDRPEQDRRNGDKQQIYLRLHRASTKNGPIDRYYIVVHLVEYTTYQTYVPQEVKIRKTKNLILLNFMKIGSSRMLLYSCCV